MRLSRSILSVVGVSTLLVACGDRLDVRPPCPDIYSFAISATIRDSVTNESLATRSLMILRDGAFVDTIRPNRTTSAKLIGGRRAGTYHITVHVDGYREWVRSNVEVLSYGGPQCAPRTTELDVRLVRH